MLVLEPEKVPNEAPDELQEGEDCLPDLRKLRVCVNADEVFGEPGEAEHRVLQDCRVVQPVCFAVPINKLVTQNLFLKNTIET